MEHKARIMLVEGDYNLGAATKKQLEGHGYKVILCADGEIAWETFKKNEFDICLMEFVLHKRNGLDLAKLIRQRNESIPILFLSAKAFDEDRISGFQHGGDAYLAKPISMQELICRIDVFIRRSSPLCADKKTFFKIGNLNFDYGEHQLKYNDGKLKDLLTQREADLLKFFCENADKSLSRDEILLELWGKDDYFSGRSMDVFIAKIRKRLKDEKSVMLETVHGKGFRFHLTWCDKTDK